MTGDGELVLGNYVVCVIDLLGQKGTLAGWSKLPVDGKLTDQCLQSIKQSLGTVEWFRNAFKNFFESFQPHSSEELAKAGADPQFAARLDSLSAAKVSVQQFSDTFVFYSPLRNDHGDFITGSIYKMFHACCMANLLSLAGRVPFRGGIAVGAGCEIEKGNFYGPALAIAHQLENEVASYPRIIVDKQLMDFLRNHRAFSKDPHLSAVGEERAQQALRMTCLDDDGRSMIDFAGPLFVQTYEEVAEGMREALKRALAFVQSEQAVFKEAGNRKLEERYQRLLNYFARCGHLS